MSKKDLNYTITFSADIDEAAKSLKTLSQGLSQLNKGVKTSGVQDGINQIERALDRLNEKAMAPINSIGAFESIKKDKIKILASLKDIGNSITELEELADDEKLSLLPKNEQERIKTAISLAQDYAKFLRDATDQKKKDLKISKESLAESTKRKNEAKTNLENAKTTKIQREGMIANHKVRIEQQSKEVEAKKEKLAILEKQVEALKKLETTKEAYEKAGADKTQEFSPRKGIVKNYAKDEEAARAVLGERFGQATVEELQKEIGDVKAVLVPAEKELTGLINTQAKWTKELNAANSEIAVYEKSLDKANEEVSANEEALKSLNDELAASAYKQMAEEAGKLGGAFANWPLDYTEQNLKDLKTALAKLKEEGVDTAKKLVNSLKGQFNGLSGSSEKLGDKINQSAIELERMDEVAKNTEAFASRVKQFVGFTGGIELARAAMRNAISTVRELDAAMTEMAVVTDLGVGDYWEQLPEYTDRANKLGVSIKSAYESATLFYQQGLKTNEVVAMSNESLKLMRIAGLGAEDATNKMTAALRGFSMELNEASAQKITDVYSELAAITAADVDEIATAMTKTASIASSAGMEFETTAAFLAQTIEATRESADAVGTSLKTVIARFQELKKDPSMIGEVDGEVVDANKIETALRSVGVALRDTNGQFRDLDQVFLDLSGKWGDLDTNTQRYIATVAAGSRQQSRFIAMISNYGRTQELVNAANTSAGASNRQYEKTLDSLASKLERLKNAWDSFTMDLANSKVIKGAVDLFTNLLTTINKLTNASGKSSGLAKIGLIAGALYLGDKAINIFTNSLKDGKSILTSFFNIFRKMPEAFDETKTSVKKSGETIKNNLSDIVATASATRTQFEHLNSKTKLTGIIGELRNLEEVLQSTKTTAAEAAQMSDYFGITRVTGEKTANYNKAKVTMKKMEGREDSDLGKIAAKRDLAKATKELEEALNAERKAYERLSDKQKDAIIDAEQSEQAYHNLEQANEDVIIKIKSLAKSYGVAEDRMDDYLTLVRNGINIEKAAIVVADDHTYAILQQSKAFEKLEDSAKGASSDYSDLEELGEVVDTLTGGAVPLDSWISSFVRVKKFFEEGGLKKAIGQLGKLLKTYWPLIVATAALTTAIVGLTHYIGYLKKVSPEGKLQAAEEAAESAAEEVKILSQNFDELNESIENLDDKYNKLKELTRGSKEWKSQVREINKEIVDLIDKAPQLRDAFERNEDGVLVLKEGKEEMLKQAQEEAQLALNRAEVAQMTREQELAFAQKNVSYDSLSKKAQYGGQTAMDHIRWGAAATGAGAGAYGGWQAGKGLGAVALSSGMASWAAPIIAGLTTIAGGIGGGIAGYATADAALKGFTKSDQEYTEMVAKAMASGEIEDVDSVDAVVDWLYKELNQAVDKDLLKTWGSSLAEASDELKEFGKELIQLEEQTKAFEESLKRAVYDNSKASSQTSSAKAWMKAISQSDAYIGLFKEEAREAIEGETGAALLKQFYEKQGFVEVKVSGDKVTYKTSKDAEATEIDLARARDSYVNAKATEKATQNLNYLPEAIFKGRKGEYGKLFEDYLSGDLSIRMTKTAEDVLGQNLKEVYESMGKEGEEAFGSFENFEKVLSDIVLDVQQKREDFDEKMAERGFGKQTETYKIISEMGIDAASAYIGKFTMVLGASGERAAADLTEDWNKLTAKLSQEQKNELTEQLSAVDWSDSQAIDTFADSLKNMGLNIPAKDTDAFIAKLKEVAHSIEKVNFDKLLESIGALQTLAQEIRSGARGREFTPEEYREITENNKAKPTDFALSNTGKYIYLGSSMTDFADVLASTPESGIRAHQQGVAMGEYLNKVFASDEITVGGLGSLTESQQRALVEDLQNTFKDSLNGVIAGFSKTTKFEDLPEDFFSETGDLQNFIAIARGGGDYSKLIQTLTASYQGQTSAANAQGVLSGYESILSGEATANDKAIFQARNKALGIQAVTAGVDESLISTQAKTFEYLQRLKDAGKENTEEYKTLLQIFEALTAEMSNAAAALQLEKGFTQAVSTMKEGINEVINLEDVYLKDTKLASVADEMGISLTGASREYKDYIQNLIKTMTSGGKDAYQAYQLLMAESAKAMNVSFENLGDLAYDKMDAATKEFVDRMIDLRMGRLEQNEEGQRFQWVSEDVFAAVQQASNATLQEWSKTYNWLYNAEAKANALIREREKLEREYSRAVEGSENMTTQELTNNILAQMDALKAERAIAEGAAVKAKNEIASLMSDNSKFAQYMTYDQANGAVYIDYERLAESGFTESEQQAFTAFLAEVEEWANVVEDNKDTIKDNTDAIKKLRDSGREEYSDLLDRVRDALIQSYQDQIDEMRNINDAIKEAQSDLVEVMQDMISEQRQARENEKTESEIADKEARLAYLMRDTSGGNAMEIANLQKEISDAKQGYTDTLIDQALTNLTDANEKAMEQREQQISLAQTQLDVYNDSKEIWNRVHEILNSSLGDADNFTNSWAGKLLEKYENHNSNPIKSQDWQYALDASGKLAAIAANLAVDEGGDNSVTLSNTLTEILNTIRSKGNSGTGGAGSSNDTFTSSAENAFKAVEELLDDPNGAINKLPDVITANTGAVNKLVAALNGESDKGYVFGPTSGHTKDFAAKQYATGGLADFTGPAWLDGTKSRPELVLNQQDTANFIALKDILSDVLGGKNATSSKPSGDNYFDISISVDKISEDYDVDQLADRIKTIIYDDATYRNVNSINLIR